MTYEPRRRPRVKQAEALARMEGRAAFALLMAMRTGKTKVVLDDFGRLEDRGRCRDLLVLAPAGVYDTWLTAIEDDVGDGLSGRLLVHLWRSGGGKGHRGRLEHFLRVHDRPRIFVMNVEAVSSVKEARAILTEFLSSPGGKMVAVDESTTIKNAKSIRTKFILKQVAPRADFRRVLSGLPTPRDPGDLFTQFYFLDKRILDQETLWSFQNRYAYIRPGFNGTRVFRQIVGWRDQDDLQRRIAPYSFRCTLDECYDLPPKMYQVRTVELTEEQRKAYVELKKFATTQLANSAHVTATQVIVQILKMHQVLCGHATDEVRRRHQLSELRTDEVLQLLAEYDGKAVVWASYDADVWKIAGRLADAYGAGAVARFWGGNRPTREQEERAFLTDPGCRFMVATPAAGGKGRNWAVADLVVYYSNTHDLEHRAQSEERVQGQGKASSVLYVDLVAPGTVDEVILKALRSKIDLAAAVTGDNWREWVV